MNSRWISTRLATMCLLMYLGSSLSTTAQSTSTSQTAATFDSSETAFLKPAVGEGTFGDKIRWKKTADPNDPTKLIATIELKHDSDIGWKSMGEYLGHSDDGKMYVRTTEMHLVFYYAIQHNAPAPPPPPPPQKKSGMHKFFQKAQDLGGGVALVGVTGGRGGEGVAKAGGAVSDVGTDGQKVARQGDKVNNINNDVAVANGSKTYQDERIQSGEYSAYSVAPNDVPHNLSTAELIITAKSNADKQ